MRSFWHQTGGISVHCSRCKQYRGLFLTAINRIVYIAAWFLEARGIYYHSYGFMSLRKLWNRKIPNFLDYFSRSGETKMSFRCSPSKFYIRLFVVLIFRRWSSIHTRLLNPLLSSTWVSESVRVEKEAREIGESDQRIIPIAAHSMGIASPLGRVTAFGYSLHEYYITVAV